VNKIYIVDLTEEERDHLLDIVKTGKRSSRKINRARILLLADEERMDREIADVLHTSVPTVQRTRQRFVEGNLEGALNERRRCGRPRKLKEEGEAILISLARGVPPAGRKKWTTQLLADRLVEQGVVDGVSDETVRRSLKEEGIKPWLRKCWCIPTAGSEFVWHMEDILSLYSEPYDPEQPLICFDEQSVQLIAETRCPIPVKPGKAQRFDYEYRRNGTRNLFAFLQPLAGWRHVKVTERRTKNDFAYCMRDLTDAFFPQADVVRVVQDNLNTHTPASLYETFEPPEARRILNRLEFHYTPKHASWLNMVEIELSVLFGQCLDRRIPDEKTLRSEIAAWEEARNTQKATVDWRFTVEGARAKLEYLYPELP
jgi:transposase